MTASRAPPQCLILGYLAEQPAFPFSVWKVKTWDAEIKPAGTGCARGISVHAREADLIWTRPRTDTSFPIETSSSGRRPQNCVPRSKNNNSGASTSLVPVGLFHLESGCPADIA